MIMESIGKDNSILFNIYSKSKDKYQKIDIILNGKNLTLNDNEVYIGQFVNDVKYSIEKLQNQSYEDFSHFFNGQDIVKTYDFIQSTNDEDSENFYITEYEDVHSYHEFLNWGPTTQDVVSSIIKNNNTYYIVVEIFNDSLDVNNEKLICEIEVDTLIDYLKELVDKLNL